MILFYFGFAGWVCANILRGIQARLGLIKFVDGLPEKVLCRVTDVLSFGGLGCFQIEAEIVSPAEFMGQQVVVSPSTSSQFPRRGCASSSYIKTRSDREVEGKRTEKHPTFMHKSNPHGLVQKSPISLVVSEEERQEFIEKAGNLDSMRLALVGEDEKKPAKLLIEINLGEVFWRCTAYKHQYVNDYRLSAEYKSSEKVTSQLIN